MVRWEYDRIPEAETRKSGHHLPTGYVPFEEVLRFCIADLGVPPLAEDWDQILRDTYEQFKTEFAE